MSKFIVSQQSNIKILNGVVNSKILNSVSKVLKYGSDAWGYQRDQKPEHIKSILEYIKLNKENCLFTNSIILAMDEQNFKIDASVNDIIDFDLNLNLGLRIVDGQHRLAAIKNSIYDFDLNVIILIIPEGERTRELDIFITINSKSKKIPTDLAELARYKYLILNNKNNFNIDQSIDYVSMKIIVDLNENSNYWKNAIKVDINEKINSGIVGVSAFKKTIHDFVKIELSTIDYNKLEELEKKAEDLKKFIEKIWEICVLKWKYCFNLNQESKEKKYPIYLNEFYIQKTMGISVIHGLVKELYIKEKGKENLQNLVLEKFENIIENSNVKSLNWKSGDVMSGYSSESGFAKIRSFIKNEIIL